MNPAMAFSCPRHAAWRLIAILLTVAAPGWASVTGDAGEILAPEASRRPVDLIGELAQPWQAGGAIALLVGADGGPRAGRLSSSPRDADEELARREEHFALASKINLVTVPGVPIIALPLEQAQIELLHRFALSDAGAVWFREVADDTLRLFNQGYLEYDERLWRDAITSGEPLRLSALLSGRLSDAGQFSQEVALFRIFAFEGSGAMAAAASVRLGLRGFRCRFPLSDELVDPHAVISHEFGHTRYGDPHSAGMAQGEALTVARYENPVRLRNGYAPRDVYYLRIDASSSMYSRDALLARALAWWHGRGEGPGAPPLRGLYCECHDAQAQPRECPLDQAEAGAAGCAPRWLAVEVHPPEP